MSIRPVTVGDDDAGDASTVYLVDHGDAATLVDAGVATEEALDRMVAELDRAGYGLADVGTVLVTHWHRDHVGLLESLQRASDATVYAHHRDAPLVRCDRTAVERYVAASRDRLDAWRVPPGAGERYFETFRERREGHRVRVEPVGDGDTLERGDATFGVLHTPGHTAGHCCFTVEADGERALFVGDALLPEHTPNLGGSDLRVDRPLERYLESLRRIADTGLDGAWPGHHDYIGNPAARAAVVRDHHRDRARAVLDTVTERGRADVWTISRDLFGDLSGYHAILGPGEVYAHSDHLVRAGVLSENGGRYRLADGTVPDIEAVL